MIYLEYFQFPDDGTEFDFLMQEKRTCYDSYYPFKVLSRKEFQRVDFEPITILYGGNGSGKTTALNIIAEKLKILRESPFNKSNFFDDYLNLCEISIIEDVPGASRIITSDDVFDYMLSIRMINEEIDNKREEIFQDYLDTKYSDFKMTSLEDYEELKKVNQTRRRTQSKYVRHKLMDNIRELSNGESAFLYFTEKISENNLYLLDEPENSLSPENQLKLVKYIGEAARYFDCQFIISTHSPFLLAIERAKIYDLDESPVTVRPWHELENIRIYYDFFQKHKDKFEKK
ncbi:AAA ATPase-like protein [Alkalibaculum bacchi]|uniref:AAA ATPase-like protein n=1 Tax=Alkalibaculum bacchi TaxID=645887 RepID=A0A366I049_9FIRM|nr:AAA family ATPase [Alkalibaculum bacchi]RBP59097.1 AAA ATPase-like protein [Alkalibaculum bacchi]